MGFCPDFIKLRFHHNQDFQVGISVRVEGMQLGLVPKRYVPLTCAPSKTLLHTWVCPPGLILKAVIPDLFCSGPCKVNDVDLHSKSECDMSDVPLSGKINV